VDPSKVILCVCVCVCCLQASAEASASSGAADVEMTGEDPDEAAKKKQVRPTATCAYTTLHTTQHNIMACLAL